MSKRANDQSNSDPKKIKLDDFDDSWGEDFDANLIDDCFHKAIQGSEAETSYACFKNQQLVVTSTQYGNNSEPQELKKLREKCREKEGEVSILRMNLENFKKEIFAEQKKKENEWREKLNDTEKEVVALKSELQLKKLEIANLRQQQMELSRLPNIEESFTQKIQTTLSKTVKVEKSDFSHKIYINSKPGNPFNLLNFSFTEDLFLEEVKNLNLASVLERKKNIRKELYCLINEASDENVKHIDKIAHDSFCILQTFQNCLKVDVQQKIWTKIGLICSEILTLLRNLVPFSSNLRKYLLYNECNNKQETSFLSLLSDILSLIIKKGNSTDFHEFIKTLLIFFSTIYGTETEPKIVELVLTLVSNYNKQCIIYEASIFLNVVTRNSDVVAILCSKQKNENCKFLEFIKTVEAQNENEILKIRSTFLGLVYNIFRTNNGWVQQENKPCDCLRKLTVMVIGIIHKSVSFQNSNVLIKVLNILTSNAYDLMQKYVSDYASFKEITYKMLHSDIDTDIVNIKKLENLSLSEDFVEIPKERFSRVHLMV